MPALGDFVSEGLGSRDAAVLDGNAPGYPESAPAEGGEHPVAAGPAVEARVGGAELPFGPRPAAFGQHDGAA